MVKETEYYDVLEVGVDATTADIKRAYRKMAIKTHPDKNPDDPQAQQKFQAVSSAYQVLSDPQLRDKYDKFGKEESRPVEGMDDPVALATSIFGGGAFESYIGEISIVREMTQLGELEEEEQKEQESSASDASRTSANNNATTASPGSGSKTREAAPVNLIGHHDTETTAATPPVTNTNVQATSEATKHKHSSPSTLEKERKHAARQKHKAALEKLDKENQRLREERVTTLTEKLIEKLSVYTEAPRTAEFAQNFRIKMEEEASNLKMESFGLQLLHTIGAIYYTRASLFLKSQKMFGFGGMFGKIKEAGTMVRDVFDAVSATMDAQSFIQQASDMEGQVQPERQAELDQMMLGKMLGALWVGSRFEIQGILRVVCDKVLHDKSVPLKLRVDRAQALKIMGHVFRETVRTPAEAEEMQFFETLVAEANAKKAKKLKKDFASGAASAAAQDQVNHSKAEDTAP